MDHRWGHCLPGRGLGGGGGGHGGHRYRPAGSEEQGRVRRPGGIADHRPGAGPDRRPRGHRRDGRLGAALDGSPADPSAHRCHHDHRAGRGVRRHHRHPFTGALRSQVDRGHRARRDPPGRQRWSGSTRNREWLYSGSTTTCRRRCSTTVTSPSAVLPSPPHSDRARSPIRSPPPWSTPVRWSRPDRQSISVRRRAPSRPRRSGPRSPTTTSGAPCSTASGHVAGMLMMTRGRESRRPGSSFLRNSSSGSRCQIVASGTVDHGWMGLQVGNADTATTASDGNVVASASVSDGPKSSRSTSGARLLGRARTRRHHHRTRRVPGPFGRRAPVAALSRSSRDRPGRVLRAREYPRHRPGGPGRPGQRCTGGRFLAVAWLHATA